MAQSDHNNLKSLTLKAINKIDSVPCQFDQKKKKRSCHNICQTTAVWSTDCDSQPESGLWVRIPKKETSLHKSICLTKTCWNTDARI